MYLLPQSLARMLEVGAIYMSSEYSSDVHNLNSECTLLSRRNTLCQLRQCLVKICVLIRHLNHILKEKGIVRLQEPEVVDTGADQCILDVIGLLYS